MNYHMIMTGCCLQGLLRPNNQDNLWYVDQHLPLTHQDDVMRTQKYEIVPGTAWAVFDGMGGGKRGDLAAMLAARTYGTLMEQHAYADVQHTEIIVKALNDVVVQEAKAKHLKDMGTTVAALCADRDGMWGFNVGDSRCYLMSDGKLSQLSVDHARRSAITHRAQLTQYLGIPEDEFILEADIYRRPYQAGDIYLLCTDGVYQSVSDARMEEILGQKIYIEEKAEQLKKIIYRRGAEDNLTMVLVEILGDENGLA